MPTLILRIVLLQVDLNDQKSIQINSYFIDAVPIMRARTLVVVLFLSESGSDLFSNGHITWFGTVDDLEGVLFARGAIGHQVDHAESALAEHRLHLYPRGAMGKGDI